MSFKIPCGGFRLDEKSFSLDENGVLSVSGGGSGGGVQPDWNQNDSTAADYIKNRPFYSETTETVLVEESTVPFTSPGSGIYYATIQSAFKPTAGETYKVSWDGVAYECVGETISGYTVIGNLSVIGVGADTGEPFVISPLIDNSGIEIDTKDASASHTISISGLVSEVIQIPDKYISGTFRDVVIAGDPLNWSEDDWTKYYGLFQIGKLLMINGIGSSNGQGYVLSMFYSSTVRNMSVVSSTGDLYRLMSNNNSEENKFYWAPIIDLGAFYFSYQQTGSDINTVKREAYKRLEILDDLTFTTKKANEEAVNQKVVLEGDKEIILSSSTSGSTKKFKITVDDSGTIKATEVR